MERFGISKIQNLRKKNVLVFLGSEYDDNFLAK
jgi:hypothetical protein